MGLLKREGRGTKAGGMEVTMVTRDGEESTGSLEKEGQEKGGRELNS